MPRNALVLCLLLAASAAGQNPPASKGGSGEIGLELTNLARNSSGSTITATVTVANKSTSNVVYLLLTGPLSATDSDGGTFDNARVNGVAYCSRAHDELCTSKDSQWFVELKDYTEIDPEQSAVFNVVLSASPSNSKGEKIFLTGKFAYRVIREADRDNDANVPDAQRLKRIRSGSLKFNAKPGEVVTSTIRYNMDSVK